MEAGTWNGDLGRLRDGAITFAYFSARHAGIVRRLALPWSRRCPNRLDLDDACQEVLLEVWRAVEDWDETRGVPLHAYVRTKVRFRLLGMTDRLLKGLDVEAKYIRQNGRKDDGVADENATAADDAASMKRRLAVVVGSLDGAAAELVMSIVEGGELETVRREVYAGRTEGGATKKARSVLWLAATVAGQV